MFQPLNIQQDVSQGIVTIEGRKYSMELFRQFAKSPPDFGWFRMHEDSDGTLLLEKKKEEIAA